MKQKDELYQEFLELLMQGLKERLGEEYNIQLNSILKNNSIHMDGIVIRKGEERITPNIYVEEFYEDYENEVPIEDIIDRITYIYFEKIGEQSEFHLEFTYDKMKEHIMYRLVNYEKNKELLKSSPFIKILDLAVTFHCMVQETEDSIGTIRITNEYLNLWGITTKELFQQAKQNTTRLLPPVIRKMDDLLKEIIQSDELQKWKEEGEAVFTEDQLQQIEDGETPMYVLSNVKGINGATCLIYPSVIRNFAKILKSDLYILPSSIHETILLPTSHDLSVEELKDMVVEINQTQVPYEEVLSDHIYYYSISKNKLTVL